MAGCSSDHAAYRLLNRDDASTCGSPNAAECCRHRAQNVHNNRLLGFGDGFMTYKLSSGRHNRHTIVRHAL